MAADTGPEVLKQLAERRGTLAASKTLSDRFGKQQASFAVLMEQLSTLNRVGNLSFGPTVANRLGKQYAGLGAAAKVVCSPIHTHSWPASFLGSGLTDLAKQTRTFTGLNAAAARPTVAEQLGKHYASLGAAKAVLSRLHALMRGRLATVMTRHIRSGRRITLATGPRGLTGIRSGTMLLSVITIFF